MAALSAVDAVEFDLGSLPAKDGESSLCDEGLNLPLGWGIERDETDRPAILGSLNTSGWYALNSDLFLGGS